MKMKPLLITLMAFTISLGVTGCEVQEEFYVSPPSLNYVRPATDNSIDYPDLINAVSLTIVRANVVIATKSYRKFGPFSFGSSEYYGTGVVIYHHYDEEVVSNSYYLALTANHVVAPEVGYDAVSYSAYDYQDYELANVEVVHRDPTYDLALVKIPSTYTDMYVMPIAELDPVRTQRIFTLGTPNFQKNAFTTGLITGFGDGNLEESDSQVDFPVLFHSAYVNSGASGGMLFNRNLELVGINYAISMTDDGDYDQSFAIPITRVHDFLEDTEYWSILETYHNL